MNRRAPRLNQMIWLPVLLGLSVSACATAKEPVPAVLESADEQTLSELTTVLGRALNRGNIKLGAGDPSEEPVLAILPPPLSPEETASLAKPMIYDIILDEGVCVAVQREGGDRIELTGISCRPA